MTNGTTTYNPGDVLLIPFPFTNLTAVKERPGLVVSARSFNSTQQDIILLAITSNPQAKRHGRHTYALTEVNCKRANLFFPSFVKTAKIITLDQRLVRQRLGTLPKAATKDIIQLMTAIFSG